MRWAWLLGLLLLTTGLAGCMADDEGAVQTASVDTDAEDEGSQALALEGENCEMGGGQSVHPREMTGGQNFTDIIPEPWRVADVLEDTGEQYTYSQWPKPTSPKPQEGNTWGHYHASLVCENWTLDGESRPDLEFGFVGPKVKTPSFAQQGADDTYVATVVATNDDALRERLERGGVHAMNADVDFQRIEDQARISMPTDHNGEYLSIYRINELGPIEDEHLRLWFQHENDDGTYSPVAVEITREGGTHFGDQGEGYFHHHATDHHAPLPGAYGHTAAVHYDGFDVSLEWGPSPDVSLEEAYEH